MIRQIIVTDAKKIRVPGRFDSSHSKSFETFEWSVNFKAILSDDPRAEYANASGEISLVTKYERVREEVYPSKKKSEVRQENRILTGSGIFNAPIIREIEVDPSKVTTYRQDNPLNCWLSTVAILLSLRDQQSYPLEAVVEMAGGEFKEAYDNAAVHGISPEKIKIFADRVGLGYLLVYNSMSSTLLQNLLFRDGPMVINVDPGLVLPDPVPGLINHSIVVTGCRDGCGSSRDCLVKYYDPLNAENRVVNFDDFEKIFRMSSYYPKYVTLSWYTLEKSNENGTWQSIEHGKFHDIAQFSFDNFKINKSRRVGFEKHYENNRLVHTEQINYEDHHGLYIQGFIEFDTVKLYLEHIQIPSSNPPEFEVDPFIGTISPPLRRNVTDIPTSELKADFSFKGLERGAIMLDGSHSTGEIKEYKWSFQLQAGTTLEEGVQFDPGVELTGKKREVVLLQPVEVTLTVSDKEKKDRMTKVIAVKPRTRNWNTDSSHDPVAKLLDDRETSMAGFPLKSNLGHNTCADCIRDKTYDDSKQHILHPGVEGHGSSNPTFYGPGFEIEEVTEGPFLGTFYVNKYKLSMHRLTRINHNLLPGSAFYKANKEYKNKEGIKVSNIDTFLKAVLKHEFLHTVLWQEYLSKNDPGKEVEKFFSGNRDELIQKADMKIHAINNVLNELEWEKGHAIIRERLHEIEEFRGTGIMVIDIDGKWKEIKYEYYLCG